MTGITHIFTLNSLSLVVLFGGLNSVESHAAYRAFSAFSFLLMLCYVRPPHRERALGRVLCALGGRERRFRGWRGAGSAHPCGAASVCRPPPQGAMSFILVRYRDEIIDDSAYTPRRGCPIARWGHSLLASPSARAPESGPHQSHPDGTFEPPASMPPAPAEAQPGQAEAYTPPDNAA